MALAIVTAGTMRLRTQELLYLLLWTADRLSHPTFRNLGSSFESWAYSKDLLREVQNLERREFLERAPGSGAEAIYRLTAKGRLAALGGYDPVEEWGRAWDGRWRLVLFDLPQKKASARAELRRFLRSSRFGYLQNSVWISPDPLGEIIHELSASAKNVESLLMLEARPAAGELDSDIVAGAWNFKKINRGYQRCLEVLNQFPSERGTLNGKEAAEELLSWGRLERRAWLDAMSIDPLLPQALLPADYLGMHAWSERVRILGEAGEMVKTA